jgi:hypothetical protein
VIREGRQGGGVNHEPLRGLDELSANGRGGGRLKKASRLVGPKCLNTVMSFAAFKEAFEDELALWPPSEHRFDRLLTDLRTHALPSVKKYVLTVEERSELQRIYWRAEEAERVKKSNGSA